MEEIKISEDEFAENVTNKLLEERLQDNQNTEIIYTTKVRESLKTVQEPTPEFEEMYKKTFGVDVVANRKEENEILDNQKSDIDEIQFAGNINESLFEDVEEYNQINYKFIGIAFSDYIIIEIKDDLYMINQFLAEEKIIYEKIKENYFNEENKDSQLLLLPDVVGLTRKQLDIAKENVEMFLKAGFDFEEFGDNTIKVTCVPSICENLNTKELFLDILDDLNTVAVTEIQEKEDKFIETISRKVAEKAAIRLDIEDIGDLMKDLLKLNNPFIGSSGKSIAIKMSKYDLERKFSRK
jgi:DNA mismatch repair protein MutL